MKRLFFLEDEDTVFQKMKRLLELELAGEELICEQYKIMEEAEERVYEPVVYDAFILNIQVEGSPYTGRYLAALIREQKQHAATPIVFVSNHPLMQAWLEDSLGLCWFVKKEEMAAELPKLMTQILGFGIEGEKGISRQRLLIKKKESIAIWVMVKDLIALRCVKREEICLFTANHGKVVIRGARGMMGLIGEQIYQQKMNCLQFINHGEIINLHFFRSLKRERLEDGKEGTGYRIQMFGCDETFIPSRQYMQRIRDLLQDRE